ncbi:hypothetical protein SFRURICE_019126 [Spodoptera frugiperda]|nr:hypothetical protein SFRURICE_019126 [Spodoptera frugiperda]
MCLVVISEGSRNKRKMDRDDWKTKLIVQAEIPNNLYTTLCTRFLIIMLKISEDLLSNNIVGLLMISLAAFVEKIIARGTNVPEYDGSRCTTPVRLAIIFSTNAASEIMSRQTMLFDKRSSLIFNMMITNRVQSVV